MIKASIPATKAATFCVHLPDPNLNDHVGARGTGFFVSSDGWFITAAHVITQDSTPTGQPRTDLDKMGLVRPTAQRPNLFLDGFRLDHIERGADLALFKGNFSDHKDRLGLDGLRGFPFIEISIRALEEGDSIYAFGFPLNESIVSEIPPAILQQFFPPGYPATHSITFLSTRLTSAVIAHSDDVQQCKGSPSFPIKYRIDKPVNPGNSGGPAIVPKTGRACGICTAFQTMLIEQTGLPWPTPPAVLVPSLYGIVQTFLNDHIIELLRSRGIPVSED